MEWALVSIPMEVELVLQYGPLIPQFGTRHTVRWCSPKGIIMNPMFLYKCLFSKSALQCLRGGRKSSLEAIN